MHKIMHERVADFSIRVMLTFSRGHKNCIWWMATFCIMGVAAWIHTLWKDVIVIEYYKKVWCWLFIDDFL